MFCNSIHATATPFKFFEHALWNDFSHHYLSESCLPQKNLERIIFKILINKV